MRLSKNSKINDVAAELIRNGWAIRRNGAHSVLTDPVTHFSYPIPYSPSCGRAEQNWLAGIRKIKRGIRP